MIERFCTKRVCLALLGKMARGLCGGEPRRGGMFALLAATLGGLETASAMDLTELSIEELMGVEVTLASRKSERLSQVPAAVFVLTRDDIRRSGARTLPEALRMVPGTQIGQIDANKWSVTVRGFPGRFATKLLVLIDGRSVYTPLMSGVFWEAQHVDLDDVDRIEVIRGPGATLWGANAMNGVINIITRDASVSPGAVVQGSVGTEDRGLVTLRFADRIGEYTHARLYAMAQSHDAYRNPYSGKQAADDWRVGQVGYRLDRDTGADHVTLQGAVYDVDAGVTFDSVVTATGGIIGEESFDARSAMRGAHVLGRWRHTFRNNGTFALQSNYDYTRIDDTLVKETRNTFDMDLQHQFSPYWRHDVVWGAGLRTSHDSIDSNFAVWVDPASRTLTLFSAFLQDEIHVVPGRWRFTIGSKIEYSSYSATEVQPNARVLWTPHPDHTAWCAVSRAVTLPYRAMRDGKAIKRIVGEAGPNPFVPSDTPVLHAVGGHDDTVAEELVAWEAGYRVRPLERLSLDLTLFRNKYDHLISGELSPVEIRQFPQTHVLWPYWAGNELAATTRGAELAVDAKLTDLWRVRAWYAYLDVQFHTGNSTDGAAARNDYVNSNANHQFNIRSAMDLPAGTSLDVVGRYVDDIPAYRVGGKRIGSYFTVDARLSWRPTEHVEIAVGGKNLFDTPRGEFGVDLLNTLATEVEPGVYASLRWEY